MNPFAVQVAQRSCIGARSRNEDCLAIEHRGGYWCLVLSDGAGGHDDGARAAQLVVARVLAGFRSRPPVDGHDLAELLLDAHDAVVAAQRERAVRAALAPMHATVVALMIDTCKRVALWGHVGDSRLYQWRGGRLNVVTRDDSVMQWVLDTGLVEASRLQTLPNRGVLLAALGSAEEAAPHVSTPFELEVADAFLLCSDGWWSALDPPAISAALAAASSPEAWLDAMMEVTIGRADPRQDNFSAIACWIADSLGAGECAHEGETWPPRPPEGLAQRSSSG